MLIHLPQLKKLKVILVVPAISWLFAGGSMAAPVLSVVPITVRPGQSTNLIVRLNSGTEGYAGFNAVLWMPADVSVQGVVPGPLIPTNTFSLYYTVSAHDTGSALAMAATSISNVMATAGILCTVSVTVASTLLPGTYPILFATQDPATDANARHALSSNNGMQSVTHGYVDGSVQLSLPPGPGDTNGNGVPDVWETCYFGGVTNISTTTDADQDGLSDYYEYLAGTNPTNPASCLAVAASSTLPSAGHEMILRWYSIQGALYDVEGSSNLVGWITIEADIPATPPLNTHPIQPAAPATPSFYRLKGR